MIRILKIVSVIIGTLIGAGFASGQEIYVFFYKYGIYGILGIVISSLTLGFTTYKVLIICIEYKVKNYKNFLSLFLKKEKQLEIINIIINIFILITFYIMIAGFGAYFKEQFGINSIIGSMILSLICYFTFIKNVSGLIKVSEYIVPVLICILLIVGMYVIDFENIFDTSSYISNNISFEWFLDSILYGSYNSILLIPVIIALQKLVKNRKEIKIVSIIIIFLLMFLSLIIFFILIKVDVNIENLEMPAVYVVSKISLIFKYMYGIIILGSILTTSVALGTSFLENVSKNNEKHKKYAILICISSVLVSNIGFSNLINLIYPIFGYIGFIQIIRIGIKKTYN